MSQDLVQDYFKRDLGPIERDSLAKLILEDGAANDRFAALAEQSYRKTGLPAPGSKPAWLRIAGAGLIALLSASVCTALCLHMINSQAATSQDLEPEPVLSIPKAHRHAPALLRQQPQAEAQLRLQVESLNQAGHDARFLLHLSLDQRAPVQVWVESGAERIELVAGSPGQGKSSLAWAPSHPGNWRVVAKCQGQAQERWVWVERR